MRRLAVAISKGGTGKSTSALSLGAGLAITKSRVLLVDTDIQSQLAKMLGVEPEHGLADILLDEIDPQEAIFEARPNLWLLAGGFGLSKAKRLISREDFKSEEILARALEPLEGQFDYVIVDTAPSYDALTVNILVYVDELICPCSMEALSVDGLGSFIQSIEPIRQDKQLELRYVLPTFVDGRVKKSEEIMAILQRHFGEVLCRPIHYSVKLSECAAWGKTIYEFAPKDRASVDYSVFTGKVARDG